MAPANNTHNLVHGFYVVSFSGMPSTYRPWSPVCEHDTMREVHDQHDRHTHNTPAETRFPAFMDSPSQECSRMELEKKNTSSENLNEKIGRLQNVSQLKKKNRRILDQAFVISLNERTWFIYFITSLVLATVGVFRIKTPSGCYVKIFRARWISECRKLYVLVAMKKSARLLSAF